jgi:acyl-coenzyme A synthetase/AMP-(fatty) acid ligase
MENVEDVVVFGGTHPITGNIVCAKFKLESKEPRREFKARMFNFCKDKLQSYKVPGKISFTDNNTYNERFKRMRR